MTEEAQSQGSAANFAGSWTLVTNENFEEFLAANGANWMIRKMASTSTPTLTVTQEGDKFSFVLKSLVVTKETNFTVGEVMEEKQHSGDIMICTPSWDGDKLVVEMKPKDENSNIKPQKQIRHVEGNQLILTLEVGDVVAKRIFKKNE